ncbi:hypothetical protein ACH427_31615 [Streptomyces sp. NPDC020379]|uniref:hypothetical protein n=1 Tax=Streptomyces sp. NPDC020379 TaxID=3365071 RepID=UPI0037A9F717
MRSGGRELDEQTRGDGHLPSSWVNPSLTTNVDIIAAGTRAGRATLTVFDSYGCTGNIIARGDGEAFFIPPIDIGSVRIDSAP